MQAKSEVVAVFGCHLERPAHGGGDGDEVEEVHPARGRVHLHGRAVCADEPVVLDDQVAADRLDVDHAAALLVGEHACASMALGAGLVVGIGEPEEPGFEVDLVAGLVQGHVGGMADGHRWLPSIQMKPGWPKAGFG